MARLFEQGEVTTPDTTDRLASGKAGSPTSNITIANFVTWLNTVLGFFKLSSNLSDGDAPTMRTNLDVYSTTEIDDELDLKADKINVLGKDNTTSYTPTLDYHPATKKFAEDTVVAKIGKLVYAARVDWNNTNITVTTFYNNRGDGQTFITSVSEPTGLSIGFYLRTSNTNWETDYEIHATSNSGTPSSAINRNPHFIYESANYIKMFLVDSSGNAQDDGKFWIRVYDWS